MDPGSKGRASVVISEISAPDSPLADPAGMEMVAVGKGSSDALGGVASSRQGFCWRCRECVLAVLGVSGSPNGL